MSKLPDYHPQTELRIESPKGRSKAFRIRYRSPDTGNKWTQLNLGEIEIANKLLKSGAVSEKHTSEKLKQILAAQYAYRDRKKKKAEFLSKNLELIEKMFEDKYDFQRTLTMKRPEDSKYQLTKAVEACGMFPLDTCDLKELANHLYKNGKDDQNRLARRITWVNSILHWLGRNKIQTVERKRSKVKYLNEVEFAEMLPHVTAEKSTKKPDEPVVTAAEVRLLARIAFYTGARIGEIFYIQARHIKAKTLQLELQMTDELLPNGSYKPDTLKNGYEREIFLHRAVRKDVEEWAQVPFSRRYEIRTKSYATIIARACKKAFGDADPIKILTFHDLRHSHAIWLLQAGATITEVAQQLGNGPDVCYRYYSGFELKKESVEKLSALVDEPEQEVEAKVSRPVTVNPLRARKVNSPRPFGRRL